MAFVYLIRAYNLEGHGILQSIGGNGVAGGSGGRIAVILETEIYYFGSFEALGGDGDETGNLTSGGPGSVYIRDKR